MLGAPDGHQPSPEELKKAEDMMTPEQKALSEERVSMAEKIEMNIVKEREEVQYLIDIARSSERVPEYYNFNDHRSTFGISGKIEVPSFEGGQDWYKYSYDIVGEERDKETMDKWKQFLSPEAYQYIIDTMTIEKTGEMEEARLYYIGKTFQAPKTSYNEPPSYWKEFPDCWIDTEYYPDYNEETDEDYSSWGIKVVKKMTLEEKEEWLKSLEKSYGSKEFHERRTVELSNKFMKESAMNFLKSTENVETVNIALDNIFHPNEIQGVDKKSSEAAARYYWIYESERGSKYIRIKNREIHEISKDKYRESSHSVEIEPHDPVFSVSELDIKQIEGSLGLESLMGDNLLETTNEQDEAIRDRLMQLAKEAEPGFIEIESRGGNEYWVDRAGYGKEYNGDPWVEEAYVDYSYKGKLR